MPCSEAPLWCLPSPYLREEHKSVATPPRENILFIHSSIHPFTSISDPLCPRVQTSSPPLSHVSWVWQRGRWPWIKSSEQLEDMRLMLSNALAHSHTGICRVQPDFIGCELLMLPIGWICCWDDSILWACRGGHFMQRTPWPYPQIIWFIHGFEWMMFRKSLKNCFSFDIFLFLFWLEIFIPPVIEHLRLQAYFFSQ